MTQVTIEMHPAGRVGAGVTRHFEGSQALGYA